MTHSLFISFYKKAIFLLFVLFSFSNTFSQTYMLSPKNLDDAVYSHVKVIGQDDEGFFLLQSNLSMFTDRDRIGFKNRKYKISYFDFNLNQKWEKLLVATEEGANVEAVTFHNDHILIIQSKWKRNDNVVTFYADVVNSAGKTSKANIKLGECRFGSTNDLGKIKLITSNSKLTAALYFEEELDAELRLQTIVFDSSLAMISKQQLTIPYRDNVLGETKYALSESGDFIALVQLSTRVKSGDKRKLIQYRLFINRVGQNQFREFPLVVENKSLTEAVLAIDKLNNNAVVAGFYADKNSNSGTGVMFSRISLSFEDTLHVNYFTIKGDSQLKLVGERNADNNLGLFNYPIQRIVLRADGGAVIIAEAAYVNEYSYYDYFTQTFNQRAEYNFDNIVVLALDADGNVSWTNVIRKNQTSTDDAGFLSSFVSTLSSDKLSIIYNGNINSNNEVICYQINTKGEMNETKIIRSNERIYILPRAGKQVDEETLIAPAIIKKKMYLVKIKL